MLKPAAVAYYDNSLWFVETHSNELHRAMLTYGVRRLMDVPTHVSTIVTYEFQAPVLWRLFADPLSIAIQSKTLTLYLSSPLGIASLDLGKVIKGENPPVKQLFERDVQHGNSWTKFLVSLAFDLDETTLLGQQEGRWGTVDVLTGILTLFNETMSNHTSRMSFSAIAGSIGASCLSVPLNTQREQGGNVGGLSPTGKAVLAVFVCLLTVCVGVAAFTKPGKRVRDNIKRMVCRSRHQHFELGENDQDNPVDDGMVANSSVIADTDGDSGFVVLHKARSPWRKADRPSFTELGSDSTVEIH